MIKRPWTAFLSLTAVTIAMMVFGSDARAQSASTASSQTYANFLLELPAARTGIALTQRYKTLERSLVILENIPLPSPKILGQISSLTNQLARVYNNLQVNINALIASRGVLEGQYQALELKKESLLAEGKVSQAQRVAVKQGQVFNNLNSLQGLVLAEKGMATPVR